MRTLEYVMVGALIIAAASCSAPTEPENSAIFNIPFTQLNDLTYPDDPDIGHRSSLHQADLLHSANLRMRSDSTFDLDLELSNDAKVSLGELDLNQWIPTIPERLRKDPYLSMLSALNQEWNRNQVAIRTDGFRSTDPSITRVDIARNCLNAYLWEVILYTNEEGKELPLAHAWFDFPKGPYQDLFIRRNGIPFTEYAGILEDWVDPERGTIDRGKVRERLEAIPVRITERNDTAYPVSGERLRKRKEVVHPVEFRTMAELCSDSTTFATFSPPGIYVRADPRRTELGRLHHLASGTVARVEVTGAKGDLVEIDLLYTDEKGRRLTHFVVGGIELSMLPVLPETEANSAWANSMGFGNHPFYESYAEHLAHDTRYAPYYAFLTDAEGVWLDSHAVGVDGPLMHFSDPERRILHLWLLSFERHALVGHVVIEFE